MKTALAFWYDMATDQGEKWRMVEVKATPHPSCWTRFVPSTNALLSTVDVNLAVEIARKQVILSLA
jgi:hypothetical protein